MTFKILNSKFKNVYVNFKLLYFRINFNATQQAHFEKTGLRLGMMAHTCKPSPVGGQGWWITRSRDRDHSGQCGKTLSLLKI